jgi:predicted transcriptional regulator
MKTQTIEIDDDTANALERRAKERGLSVRELLAELVLSEPRPVVSDGEGIAELDRRWKAFGEQESVVANDEVVRWLGTWGNLESRIRSQGGSKRIAP